MSSTSSESPPPDNGIYQLTIKEILARLKGSLKFSREERTKKDVLICRVLRDASATDVEFLHAAGREKQEGQTRAKAERKRKRADEIGMGRRVAARSEHTGDPPTVADPVEAEPRSTEPLEHHTQSAFLQIPSQDELYSCYRAFYEATSNTAVASAVCGICGREIYQHDSTSVLLDELPNSHRLIPKVPHSQHYLVDEKLFERAGISEDNGEQSVNSCNECLSDLKKAKDVPPRFSLANNLWIGPVPWVLQTLTFPEQLLIALLYPRVYVFKLFPKKYSKDIDLDSLQRGMRGTVSTYDLNLGDTVDMLEGNMLPRRPAILASVLSITFVGLGDLSKHWLRSMFRVRRQAVLDALQWLKENNPKYYGDIVISTERLADLPEDDVPVEVMGVVRQSDDVGVIDRESEGYAPRHDDSDEEERLTGSYFPCSTYRSVD